MVPPVPNACVTCGVSAWHHTNTDHAYQSPSPQERGIRRNAWSNLNKAKATDGGHDDTHQCSEITQGAHPERSFA